MTIWSMPEQIHEIQCQVRKLCVSQQTLLFQNFEENMKLPLIVFKLNFKKKILIEQACNMEKMKFLF